MTLPASYFDALYAESRDPWHFRTRWYEARKRSLTLSCLPDQHYASIFEPGCSFGQLTAELAGRADQVLAMDISPAALDLVSGMPGNVTVTVGRIPHNWPDGHFDLTVLSEIAYYFDESDCSEVSRLSAATSTDLLAVHWRHPVADYPLTGDEAHAILYDAASDAGMLRIASHLEKDLRLDLWSHEPRSVAERTGMRP